MSRSPFAPRRLGVVLSAAGLVLALGSAASAADEFEFADGLSRRGYTDLAAEIFNELLNDPKASRDKKAEGQYGLATLAYTDARFQAAVRSEKRRLPMEEVIKLFDAADVVFAKFIADNAAHARVLEAKLTRAKLLQDKAEFVNLCIEEERLPPGSTPGQWQKQVADWFDVAIKLLDDNLKKAKDDKEKFAPGSEEYEEANDRLTLVWLFRISALYGKGAALPKGDAAGEASLKQTIKEGSDDFQWEAGSTVRGLWAMYYAGMASYRLGDLKNAWSFLRGAWGPDEKSATPPALDVTFQAFRELGRICLETGNREGTDWIKKGLECFEDLGRKWPEHLKHPEGQRAALAHARLLDRSGRADAARALVEKVVKAAENTYARPEAVKLLGNLISAGPVGAGGDPEQLTKVAGVKFREEDYRGAIRAYQSALAACKTREQWDQYGWKSWEQIGNCYGLTQRYWEAYLAFDRIEQAWRKNKNDPVLSEMTNETGFKRAGALDALVRQTKDPADKALAAQALEEFTRDHPESPRNQGAQVRDADQKYRDALSFKDDPAAFQAKMREALKAHGDIPPATKSIDQIQARIADIHRKLGDFQKSIELADAWLAAKRPDTQESAVLAARRTGRALALVTALGARADLAAALDKAKDPKAADAYKSLLDALGKLEKDYLDAVSGGQANVDGWRAEALIGTGQVDQAEEMVGKLIEQNPDSANNTYLAARIGAALERTALEWRAKTDESRYQQYMVRAARRREWALDRLKTRSADAVRSVAKMYADGHEFTKAEALLNEAQKLYVEARDAASDAEKKKTFGQLERACRIDLINLLVLQEKFDRAIPQLETEMVFDPKKRAEVIAKLQKDIGLSEKDFEDLIAKMDANRELLDGLSQAYMKAPSKERMTAAVVLCRILEITTKKDDRHGKEWIDVLLRRAEATLGLAAFTKLPEHWKAADAVITNQIVIPGLLEAYDQELPGSKRRAEEIQRRARDGLRAAGGK